MGRTFKDTGGHDWEVTVSPQSKREWLFRRVEGEQRDDRLAPAPTHVDDPFEVSEEELQRLFERSRPRFKPRKEPPPGLR